MRKCANQQTFFKATSPFLSIAWGNLRMNPSRMTSKKLKKVSRNVSISPEIARAAGAAIEAGLAKDFSGAVELALRTLLRGEGFPEEITEEQLRARLQISNVDLT